MTTNQVPKRDPLDELNQQIHQELQKWTDAGMSLKFINVDVYLLSKRLDVIIELLQEANLYDPDKANLRLRELYLEGLKHIRQENEANVRRERMAIPKMFGPNGEVLQ